MAAVSTDGKDIKVFQPIETVFTRAKKPSETIATEKMKWDLKLRRKKKVVLRSLSLDAEPWLYKQLHTLTRKVYKALSMKGFARIDVRVDEYGRCFVIDVNPNPDLGQGFETAEILRASGYNYTDMIELAVSI